MAVAKKGLRKIVVQDQTFYWKFNEKIIIMGGENGSGLLITDFGWFDVWLYVNDKKNRPEPHEPQQVTPEFVSKCIQYALAEKWNPENSTAMNIYYRNNEFSLTKPDSNN